MIHWDVSPILLSAGPIQIRWYGLLFAISFYSGYQMTKRIFVASRFPLEELDRLLMYMMVGTIAGARIGHCLFYEPQIYLADPIRILKVWEGGLASHGAAIGITLALWLFSRKYPRYSLIWLLDRLCVPVALSGGLIRLGNLFNSEILGRPTSVPWAFIFERVDRVPRHPAQLYESLAYLITFAVIYQVDQRVQKVQREVSGNRSRQPIGSPVLSGKVFGIFLILIFTARFFLEFLKENQVAFESSLPLDLGQLLSVPAVLVGVYLVVRSRTPTASEREDAPFPRFASH